MRKNKLRRLKYWDYSRPSFYFLTLCVKDFEPIFGTINYNKVKLSAIGYIVKHEFLKSFAIRETLKCIEYVIMPDHMHMIVEIIPMPVAPQASAKLHRTPRSISSFIACFKAAATKRINDYRNTQGKQVWILRFYDRVIRSNDELKRIRHYIIQNPYKAYLKLTLKS
jgi:putative transposase